MLDREFAGIRYDIMGRPLPERERSSFEDVQVYHSTLLDKDYTSAPALEDAERRERLKRSTPSDAELALEQMPREEWEPLLRAGAMREHMQETAPERVFAGDTFVAAHPEMRDSRSNATKMLKTLTEAGKNTNPSIYDMELAYNKLVQAGEIEFNKAALVKQHNARIIAAAKQHREEIAFNEEEAEKLPLAELYRRGGGGGRWL